LGAALVSEKVAAGLKPGDHGSTFAGGPLACRAAQVVLERISRPAFLTAVRESGAYLRHRLQALESDKIVAVRGAGLLLGIECAMPVAPLVAAARDHGLLIINAGDNVLRLCPPLIVNRDQIDQAVTIIGTVLD
jgi:acetylornithine/succinyldiaminopimelate/putrescine aminotransferase